MEKNGNIPAQQTNGHTPSNGLAEFFITNAQRSPATGGHPPKRSRVLSSWKEIAHYINRGVRTVQRWEIDYGLPIHRPKAEIKGSVYALKDELDTWLVRVPSRDADTPLMLADRPKRLEAECERIREELVRVGQRSSQRG
jgi:hypothetical protein